MLALWTNLLAEQRSPSAHLLPACSVLPRCFCLSGGEPIVVEDRTFIFFDSEGLGSTDQHATFDTQLFSLSLLLSSLFVLNTFDAARTHREQEHACMRFPLTRPVLAVLFFL